MARYLVTGAAGFIGAAVSELLLKDGYTVVGLDNLNDAYDVRMKVKRLNKLTEVKGFTFHKNDISNRHTIEKFKDESFDAIVHLAARAGVRFSVENPWEFINSNVTGTLNMLELCRQAGTKKFILASTSSIYGADPPYPTTESAESSQPLQPYAASKKAAEVLCHAYHHLYGLDVSVLRYFTVYGPAGRPDLALFRFVKWIREGQAVIVHGNGLQSRGFTYIDDIARGTVQALKPVGYEIINLGGAEVTSLQGVIGMIEAATGKKAEIHYEPGNPVDVATSWANTTKAMDLLGWEPKVDMPSGVAQTAAWYEQERGWAKEIKL
jgi:nucleoside-diphosphate-sugar epimerase